MIPKLTDDAISPCRRPAYALVPLAAAFVQGTVSSQGARHCRSGAAGDAARDPDGRHHRGQLGPDPRARGARA